jgi:hypothetical protein
MARGGLGASVGMLVGPSSSLLGCFLANRLLCCPNRMHPAASSQARSRSEVANGQTRPVVSWKISLCRRHLACARESAAGAGTRGTVPRGARACVPRSACAWQVADRYGEPSPFVSTPPPIDIPPRGWTDSNAHRTGQSSLCRAAEICTEASLLCTHTHCTHARTHAVARTHMFYRCPAEQKCCATGGDGGLTQVTQ